MASISNRYLSQRFRPLIWSCLDFDLLRTATFFAERYFYIDQENHEARHLFALTLLKSEQKLSALHLVDLLHPSCPSCIEIYAQCCNALGRYIQGREALRKCLQMGGPSDLGPHRESKPVPDEAILECRMGYLYMRTNLSERAAESFAHALTLNPLLWEAFEGLCAAGSFPDIDQLFPAGTKSTARFTEDSPLQVMKNGPLATGAGFFTPDTVA
ncbi:hypothetical protein M422DRAFT_783439 [Sphaerobolus stellatus SS14]|uniref:Uncharacterized protein n=1 Tax=Sphaerobolus stellatus (strain SS14) TaxID=990650 RepID=A0A0C9V4W4_SPHS4|nr:hypothetical protein M422DRAFT_783439 [Sphaerobolus stellatus SS14]